MSELTPAPRGYPIKLVRDRTPEIINATGEPGDLFYGRLPTSANFGMWLRRKLVEELGEYLEARSVPELTDVVAVLDALATVYHGRTLEDLIAMARADERGGFFAAKMMWGRHPEFDGRDTSGDGR